MSEVPRLELSVTRQEIDRAAAAHFITLDNPATMNSLTPEMHREIRDGILHAYDDPRVQSVVIRSAGADFASGGDLKTFLDLVERDGPDAYVALDAAFGRLPFRAALRCPKVVISVVNGLCLGGGLVLALCSDVVIASRQARFGAPEAKVGMFEPFVAEILPLVVGLSRARDMVVTGCTIDASTAERWGIVTRLVDDEPAGTAELDRVLAQVRRTAPRARGAYKRAMTAHVPDTDPVESFGFAAGRDGREGLRAFRDGREPDWASIDVSGSL